MLAGHGQRKVAEQLFSMTLNDDHDDGDDQQVNLHIPDDELRTCRSLSSSTRPSSPPYFDLAPSMYRVFRFFESDNKWQQNEMMENEMDKNLKCL